MYPVELEIPFQQNISENFLNIINQLRASEQPGRIFDLTREPTKDELRFLTNNYWNEIGLIRLSKNRTWKMIEGKYSRIEFPIEIEESSDIDAHYHPIRESLSTVLPGRVDIFYVNPGRKSFIINNEGLTYYSEIKRHPTTEFPWKPTSFKELTELFSSFTRAKALELNINRHQVAEMWLEKMGVIIIQKPWQKLPNNPFSGFKLEA